jgi:tRNA (guanine-N7-)-methyltransferase
MKPQTLRDKSRGIEGKTVAAPDGKSARQLDTEFNYIRRRGRFTRAQASALETLTNRYRWTPDDLSKRPLGVEIGFGMGFELLAWAQQQPDYQLLGAELYQPGIGSLLSRLENLQITNVRLVDQPAQRLFAQLDEGSLSQVRIFFPDPWPKKRHHKRRLIQPDFLQQLHRCMHNGAIVRLATDWAEYAQWMVEHFAGHIGFELISDEIRAAQDEPSASVIAEEVRDVTKFEARGERLGHEIRDLQYRRISGETT